ncbi:MAG: hypothetical protein M1821_009414 [Bathelium mastoideum]|nr:MAG: hypothetical protein M1821_009414 [Bathelium mastoideum]KAI9675574.1 MAG: hypothetical protein M1822_008927 [Bathelium mastoideum]
MYSKTLTFTLLALNGFASTLAAPFTKRGVPDNTQSCNCVDHPTFQSYSVDIGVSYNNGDGCDAVYNAIFGRGVALTNWQCVADDSGNTQLWFNTPIQFLGFNPGDIINSALTTVYPTVNGFNCPNY